MSLFSFIDYLRIEKNYSDHTIKAYQKDLETFVLFCEETYQQSDITAVHYGQIRHWISSLVSKGLQNSTINRKVSSLKTFYTYLLRTEQITQDPLANHRSLKTVKKVQVPFSEEEINEVIAMLEKGDDFTSLRNRLLVELFYSTGIRRAELIHIKVSDINIYNGTLKVLGKRNKERILPLLPSVLSTLEAYMPFKKQCIEQNEYLFVTDKGNKIYETLVYRIINSYFSHVSPKVKKSPHILRHSFASHLLNQGADLNSVKELLGHASLASTQVYTHNSLEKIKQVYNQAHPRSHKTSDL